MKHCKNSTDLEKQIAHPFTSQFVILNSAEKP